MRWQVKAAIQRSLSVLPKGEELNFLLQKRVLRSFPVTDGYLQEHFHEGMKHIEAVEAHGRVPLADVRAYEFGVGWTLIGPLTFWMAGIDRQTIVDISALMRWPLVNDSIARMSAMHDVLEARAGRPLRRIDPRPLRTQSELQNRFGIDYRAPLDARVTGLPAGSMDLISSTNTLEHIPEDDIAAIMRECARLLSADGLVSCRVDLQDHYSFFDSGISVYNYLRYSDRAWKLVNSRIHYQNRLRARDYLAFFEQGGLQVTDYTLGEPTPEHRATLSTLPIATRFTAKYRPEELIPVSIDLTATLTPRCSPASTRAF